jgi:DnaJ-class molecular chaperone
MNFPKHISPTDALANNVRAEGEAGVSPSSVSPTFACPDCNGEGEAYWMALDATDYSLEECPFCDGTGLHTQAMQSREAY